MCLAIYPPLYIRRRLLVVKATSPFHANKAETSHLSVNVQRPNRCHDSDVEFPQAVWYKLLRSYIKRKENWIVLLHVSRHSCPIIDTTASAEYYKLQGIGLIVAWKRLNPASTSGYVGGSHGSILAVVHGKSFKPSDNVIPW